MMKQKFKVSVLINLEKIGIIPPKFKNENDVINNEAYSSGVLGLTMVNTLEILNPK